jgi:hypothetical protein
MRAVASALHAAEVKAAKDITETKAPLVLEHQPINGKGNE